MTRHRLLRFFHAALLACTLAAGTLPAIAGEEHPRSEEARQRDEDAVRRGTEPGAQVERNSRRKTTEERHGAEHEGANLERNERAKDRKDTQAEKTSTSTADAHPRDVVFDSHINKSMADRGWTEADVRRFASGEVAGTTRDDRGPDKTSDGKKRDDPASVYGTRQEHVIINDNTREVVQVTSRDGSWRADSRIQWKDEAGNAR